MDSGRCTRGRGIPRRFNICRALGRRAGAAVAGLGRLAPAPADRGRALPRLSRVRLYARALSGFGCSQATRLEHAGRVARLIDSAPFSVEQRGHTYPCMRFRLIFLQPSSPTRLPGSPRHLMAKRLFKLDPKRASPGGGVPAKFSPCKSQDPLIPRKLSP